MFVYQRVDTWKRSYLMGKVVFNKETEAYTLWIQTRPIFRQTKKAFSIGKMGRENMGNETWVERVQRLQAYLYWYGHPCVNGNAYEWYVNPFQCVDDLGMGTYVYSSTNPNFHHGKYGDH